MSDLSKYKDTFGVPGQGVHSYRVADVAVLDVAMTAVGAFGISKVTGWSFWKTLVGAFVVGEAAHYAFGVDTKVMRVLGLSEKFNSENKQKCPMAFQ
jgi:hypothetical protein